MVKFDTLEIDTPLCNVQYRQAEKSIFVTDKVDRNNEPAAYTKRKRGLDKIWGALLAKRATVGETLTMRDVTTTFTEFDMPYHYWCRMD